MTKEYRGDAIEDGRDVCMAEEIRLDTRSYLELAIVSFDLSIQH